MKSRKIPPRSSDTTNAVIEELSGYVDMGMKNAAWKLVRKILAKRLIEPAEFNEVIITLGMFCSSADLRKWKEVVESAYVRQSSKTKRAMNGNMLKYYYTLEDSKNALRFLSAREMQDISNALFIMELLLENERMKEAKRFARRCERALACKRNRFEVDLLIQALAVYHARIRDWDKAICLWQHAPLEEGFRQNATSGIVSIHLARALDAIRQGLKALDHLKKCPDSEHALVLPGNDEGLTLDAEKALLKFKRGIEKLLPEKRRRELGLMDTDA